MSCASFIEELGGFRPWRSARRMRGVVPWLLLGVLIRETSRFYRCGPVCCRGRARRMPRRRFEPAAVRHRRQPVLERNDLDANGVAHAGRRADNVPSPQLARVQRDHHVPGADGDGQCDADLHDSEFRADRRRHSGGFDGANPAERARTTVAARAYDDPLHRGHVERGHHAPQRAVVLGDGPLAVPRPRQLLLHRLLRHHRPRLGGLRGARDDQRQHRDVHRR